MITCLDQRWNDAADRFERGSHVGVLLRTAAIVQANDSDIIKAYVAAGLGIGIVPTVILDRKLDVDLRSIDVTELFPRAHTNIVMREDMHLRSYVRDFIQMMAPGSKHPALKRNAHKV